MIIKRVPIMYEPNTVLDTSVFGLINSILTGSDTAVHLGNILEIQNLIYIYVLQEPASKHIIVSPSEINWKDVVRGKNVDMVCLYSQYLRPNKSCIVCRYIDNYFDALGWITNETHYNVESVIAGVVEQIRKEYGYMDLGNSEEFFITDRYVSAFDVASISYVAEHSDQFYKIRPGMFHPNLCSNKKNLLGLLRTKVLSICDNDSECNVSSSPSHPNDCDCINYVLHLPIKKISCIYYPKKDVLDVKYFNLHVSCEKEMLEQQLVNICKLYSNKTEQVIFEYDNENINIETDVLKHYINIPVLDLINQLIQIVY